jgi:hypothetical protein
MTSVFDDEIKTKVGEKNAETDFYGRIISICDLK